MAYPQGDRVRSGRLQPPTTAFGRVVDAVFARRGISATQVATRCGIERTDISHVRLGRHVASLRLIAGLADGLGLTDAEVATLLRAGLDDTKDAMRRGGRS